jgi:hypothetical protein
VYLVGGWNFSQTGRAEPYPNVHHLFIEYEMICRFHN